jgi:hypothetical protein
MLVALSGSPGVLDNQKDCNSFAGSERQVDQVASEEIDCDYPKEPPAKEGFIMGYGGYLTLVNGSPFDWVTSSTHSYQMDTWTWPTVGAGTLSDWMEPGQYVDTAQAKPRRYMSNLERKVRRRMMQARFITTSLVPRTSSPYWLGNLRTTSSRSLSMLYRRNKVRKDRTSIWGFDTMPQ